MGKKIKQPNPYRNLYKEMNDAMEKFLKKKNASTSWKMHRIKLTPKTEN